MIGGGDYERALRTRRFTRSATIAVAFCCFVALIAVLMNRAPAGLAVGFLLLAFHGMSASLLLDRIVKLQAVLDMKQIHHNQLIWQKGLTKQVAIHDTVVFCDAAGQQMLHLLFHSYAEFEIV